MSSRPALWCSEPMRRAVRGASAARAMSVRDYLDAVVLPVVRQDLALVASGAPGAAPMSTARPAVGQAVDQVDGSPDGELPS